MSSSRRRINDNLSLAYNALKTFVCSAIKMSTSLSTLFEVLMASSSFECATTVLFSVLHHWTRVKFIHYDVY